MRSSPATTRTADVGLHYISAARFLGRFRYQAPIGLLFVAGMPALAYHGGNVAAMLDNRATLNSVGGSALAFLIALFLFRRVISFPGIGIVAHVLPAAAAGFGLVQVGYLGTRWNYSGVTLLLSFAACIALLLLVSMSLRSTRGRRFYVVPSPTIEQETIGAFEWTRLRSAIMPDDPHMVLIADLHAELAPEWEKLIADVAVAGYPVYHYKQVRESLTGRVTIEHLSENSFGSLIPNLNYRKIKRAADLIGSLVALPLILAVGLVIALAIRFDSSGPVFFRQSRRGHRGGTFTMVKFRTMVPRDVREGGERDDAITRAGDLRVTQIGKLLRRTRLDELPQVWNVLRGEMSWIGPRPEALALSKWYADQLPFYTYRHIVRPGITGWAQVNQGHVADLDAVFEKLQYDFYYIKNYSAWLDLLIIWRTVQTMMSGFGAR